MSADGSAPEPAGWWTKPALPLTLILLAGVPLWASAIPPLTDLLGHMGRYAVQLDAGRSPDLARWYQFDWQWIGNLGVDLLVQLLGPYLGVEAATKLIVIAIPMLTVAGFLAVAHEAHGRVPPTAFFTLPLAYSLPFFWGFVNFALSMALAFLAFALWLRLARLGRDRLRFLLFAPLSLVLWTAHIYGWATLCVLAGSAEWMRAIEVRPVTRAAVARAGARCLCLLPPLVLMAMQFRHGGAGGQPFGFHWFDWPLKVTWLASVLRDRWALFDQLSVLFLCVILFLAQNRAWVMRAGPQGRALGMAAALFAVLYVLMPHTLLGSAYADMRLLPYVLATAFLAIGPSVRRAQSVASVALAFAALRLIGTGWSAHLYDRSLRAELTALDHLPRGARLLTFVGKPCTSIWAWHRLDHIAGLALVRRHAFANDQWQAQGAQLISVHYPAAGRYESDPSQFIVDPRCAGLERHAFPHAISSFPRAAFDYVWIVQPPEMPMDQRGLQPIWRNGRSGLYRIVTTE